jgi:hypothetical protein
MGNETYTYGQLRAWLLGTEMRHILDHAVIQMMEHWTAEQLAQPLPPQLNALMEAAFSGWGDVHLKSRATSKGPVIVVDEIC